LDVIEDREMNYKVMMLVRSTWIEELKRSVDLQPFYSAAMPVGIGKHSWVVPS
jgi:hypothetical protein